MFFFLFPSQVMAQCHEQELYNIDYEIEDISENQFIINIEFLTNKEDLKKVEQIFIGCPSSEIYILQQNKNYMQAFVSQERDTICFYHISVKSYWEDETYERTDKTIFIEKLNYSVVDEKFDVDYMYNQGPAINYRRTSDDLNEDQ